jgi:hypothetical protein
MINSTSLWQKGLTPKQMSAKGKNLVELTEEQYAAFKLLFPLISTATTAHGKENKRHRRKNKVDYRNEIAREWKRKYPFS